MYGETFYGRHTALELLLSEQSLRLLSSTLLNIFLEKTMCEAINKKSTYAKEHGSGSVDALQRKEAEESACGKVHDPAFKIYFQEKITM